MLKLSDEHARLFDELTLDGATIQSKFSSFLAAIHDEQKALKARSAALWHEVMTHHGLSGNWRYQDGSLHPVETAQGAALATVPPPDGQIAG